MTPIERACRTAYAEHNDTAEARQQADNPDWDGWKGWLPVILPVLEVFSDPSDLSGLALRKMPGEYRAGSHSGREIYRAMFKAMMEEGA